MNRILIALFSLLLVCSFASAMVLPLDLMPSVTSYATSDGAKKALKTWLDCFVAGDGGTFYDMMPYSTKTKFDTWFEKISSMPEWQADPQSANVPTARTFLIMAFNEAAKSGQLVSGITEEQFNSVASTCVMNGDNATFTGSDGKPLTFFVEGSTWKMDKAFADWMVDAMIESVDSSIK